MAKTHASLNIHDQTPVKAISSQIGPIAFHPNTNNYKGSWNKYIFKKFKFKLQVKTVQNAKNGNRISSKGSEYSTTLLILISLKYGTESGAKCRVTVQMRLI